MATQQAPGNAEVHAILACAYCFAGQYEAAVIHHETSLRLSPICPNWYLLPGSVIDLCSGRILEAIETLEKAIAIEPESPLCRLYLINVLIEIGETDKPWSVAQEIKELDDSFRIRGLLRTHSYDKKECERFRNNLLSVGLKE